MSFGICLLNALHQVCQFSAGLLDRHAGFQTCRSLHPTSRVIQLCCLVDAQRRPETAPTDLSSDADRTHDSNDRHTLAVDPQRLADNISIAAIKLLPQLVAEYGRERLGGFVVFRREIATEYRMHTQHFEVA